MDSEAPDGYPLAWDRSKPAVRARNAFEAHNGGPWMGHSRHGA